MLWRLLLLLAFYKEASSLNVGQCYLKFASVENSSSGQLDCPKSGSPANRSMLTVQLTLIQVRWRDGQFESRISGLNSTRQITEFAPNALSSLAGTEGLLLHYLNMSVLEPQVLEPLGTSLRQLRFSNTTLTTLVNDNLASLRVLQLLVFTDNHKLSCVADDAFQGLSDLRELRIERSLALKSLSISTFKSLSSLRTLVLEDTGLVTLSPRLFCSLFRLENFEWSSRHQLLNATCLTFAALTQLRSLSVKQRPNVFDERNLVQDNLNCILCPLRQLVQLDGETFFENNFGGGCSEIEVIKQLCAERIYTNETCNWPLPLPVSQTSADFELSTASISVPATSDGANSSIIIAWLIASLSIVLLIMIVGFCCFQKRFSTLLGVNCVEYCQLFSKSYPIRHSQKSACSTPRDLHNENGFVVNVKDENDYEIDPMLTATLNVEGTFFVIKNGQWPVASVDNLSLHSKGSSWSIDSSKIPTTFI